jgi:hypothetical protein
MVNKMNDDFDLDDYLDADDLELKKEEDESDFSSYYWLYDIARSDFL